MKNLIYCLLIFALISCNSEQYEISDLGVPDKSIQLTPEEYLSITIEENHELPVDDVNSMVDNFINMIDSTKSRSTSIKRNIVSNKEYLAKEQSTQSRSYCSKLDSIPIYNVELRDENISYLALVSADKRAPGVIAYFTTNSTLSNDVKEILDCPNYKAISTLAKMQLIKDISLSDSILPELRSNTIDKICNTLNIPKSSYSLSSIKNKISVKDKTMSRTHGGIEMPTQQIILQKQPMSKILWDQKTPYNRGCPEDNILISIPGLSFVQKGHVPAGCVTIACMMIEACVERSPIGGIPMNWTYYKSNRTLFEASEGQTGGSSKLELERAGKAIRYIFDQLHSTHGYKYHNGERYVYNTCSSYGENYIINNFNYSKIQSFDPDVVLSSLNSNKPIYISGYVTGNTESDPNERVTEGHAFVIDGYIICEKSYSITQASLKAESRADIVKYYDMYWHLNLGWGNGSSAYFKLESDATCSPEFNDRYGRYNLMHLNSMTIIPNISKK